MPDKLWKHFFVSLFVYLTLFEKCNGDAWNVKISFTIWHIRKHSYLEATLFVLMFLKYSDIQTWKS